MIVIQIADSGAKCLSCGWAQEVLYVTALEESQGFPFYEQNGGFCAECFLSGSIEAGEVLEVHAPDSV